MRKARNKKEVIHESDFILINDNPFIEAIEEYIGTENLPKRLATSPLDGLNVRALGVQARMDLLDRLQEEYFEPTSTSLEIATRLYRLIRRGYLNRNPTQPSVRKMTMELAGYFGQELREVPWFSTYAKGVTITGVTGVGKSHEIKRALKLLPKYVDHDRSQGAGWAKMKQVVWLYVAMSHDGSLGGLLIQILQALDEVIGTQYSQDRSYVKSSNEKLAVRMGVIFRNHGVGALFIDELQSRNFEGKCRGGLAATFFLRLLNFGIPVVLIGNPLGLKALYSFSQDVRRIGSGGTIDMHPLEVGDFDWKDCLAKALWKQSLMPEPSPVNDADGKILFQYSGGIKDYACRILVASQRLALELGNQYVTADHMRHAFLGPDFSDKERNLVVGFRDKDLIRLQQFEDIPWVAYADRWGLLCSNNRKNPDTSQHINGSVESSGNDASEKNQAQSQQKPVSQKEREQINRKRTREKNMANNRAISLDSFGGSDMRGGGLKEYLVRGFEALLGEEGKDA